MEAVKLLTDGTILVGSNIKVVPGEEHPAEDALIKEDNSPFDFQWE